MNWKWRKRAVTLARLMAPGETGRWFREVEIHDLGFGYDPFGLEKETALLALVLARKLHKYWFRVESHGLENIPLEGPVMITPNHSGVLPFDAAMIGVDMSLKLERPRIMRAVVDNYAGFLPYVNTFFYRCGQVIGARRNFEELLNWGELVVVFPEGDKGTGKPFRKRYQPVPFNVGFLELSLIHRTPIVPAAVIGAEEQYPFFFNIRFAARALQLPYFPVTPFIFFLGPLGAIPLPTKYHIYYGEPLHFYRDYPPETVQDPETVRKLVRTVQDRVEELIRRGMEERSGVFGLDVRKQLTEKLRTKPRIGKRKQIRQRTGS